MGFALCCLLGQILVLNLSLSQALPLSGTIDPRHRHYRTFLVMDIKNGPVSCTRMEV